MAAKYDVLREILKENLPAYTDRTLTDIEALDADVALTQKRGYAYDRGEFRDNILSFGAAISLPDGEPIAGVGISVPEFNLPKGGEKMFGQLVVDAARRISRKFVRT